MHDTLKYMSRDPIHRSHHHGELTFGLIYAFTENFVLPISHDEVVHGKGSLLAKMPGDAWQKFANLRAYYGFMWGHPGKKLLFMGCEFAQGREWNHESSLDWHQLEIPAHAGVQRLVKDLNQLYRASPALYSQDFSEAGFEWIDHGDARRNLLSFVRKGREGQMMLVLCNFRAGRARGPAPGRASCRPLAGAPEHRLHLLRRQQCGHAPECGLHAAGRQPRPAAIHHRQRAAAGHRIPRMDWLARRPGTNQRGRRRPDAGGRSSLAAGCPFRWQRGQLRRVLGPRLDGRSLPVRTGRPGRDRPARVGRSKWRCLARPAARGCSGTRLRLARTRPLAAREGAPFQPAQAAAGPLGARDRAAARRLRLAGPSLRSRSWPPFGTELAGQRRTGAEGPRRSRHLRLAGRPSTRHAAGRQRALRSACAWFQPAAAGPARKPARQLCGTGQRLGHRALQAPGHHRAQPDAGSPAPGRITPGGAGVEQLLGLQHAGLLLPRPALRQHRPPAAGVPQHGPSPACCGHRGHPRRGLQPHPRRRRERPHAVLARPGQPELVSPARRPPGPLSQLERLRQRAQRAPSARAADGDGQPALLGAGDARRRLSLRPGADAGPWRFRLRA
jgi:hypothetical protein